MNDHLIAFITARLAEDAARATAAASVAGPDWKTAILYPEDDTRARSCLYSTAGGFLADIQDTPDYPDLSAHIALHDPARAFREISAKRARLACYTTAQTRLDDIAGHPGRYTPGDEGLWLGKAAAARMACRHDAAIWDTHPDYQPEWAPGQIENRR